MGIPPLKSQVKETRVRLLHSGLFRGEDKVQQTLKLAGREFILLHRPESVGHNAEAHVGAQIC
jgi:hypothetical protein